MPADAQELSRPAYERLQAELDELTGEGRIDIARKIEAARALGDLSENGDYHAAKDHQGKMESRIRQLQSILIDAVIVDEREASNVVGIGTVVTIRFDGDDDTERYLVGSIEERVEGLEVVSPGSPMGQALMGKAVGDTCTYAVKGNPLQIEVVELGQPE